MGELNRWNSTRAKSTLRNTKPKFFLYTVKTSHCTIQELIRYHQCRCHHPHHLRMLAQLRYQQHRRYQRAGPGWACPPLSAGLRRGDYTRFQSKQHETRQLPNARFLSSKRPYNSASATFRFCLQRQQIANRASTQCTTERTKPSTTRVCSFIAATKMQLQLSSFP